jgi:hypothetical protein
MNKILSAIFCLGIMLFTSCKSESPADQPISNAGGTYFSIKQFIKDQWDTYHGQPYTVVKIVKFNGKVDSTTTGAFSVNWADIFDVFFQSDISDKKFLGQYDFSTFEDATTMTRNFYYEAKNNKLYTRKLQIMADSYNNKVKSVYIETEKSDESGTRTQKLFYRPVKSITIQEYSGSLSGPKKELIIEYRFM